MTLPLINPYYTAAPTSGAAFIPAERTPAPVYARLPQAPITGSPVPRLTSLYHFTEAGPYGSRSYPGNYSGELIKDVLQFYQPSMVFDPMRGSGTCSDVCDELGIPCLAFDIHEGFDACDPHEFPSAETFEFIWAHPAYWRMKLYADDPRDLSRCATLEEFLKRYGQFIRNSARSLKPGGRLAILMGFCAAWCYVALSLNSLFSRSF